MKFYLNKPIISEREKILWEKGEILPKITLNQYEIIEGTIDDMEEHIIDFIKRSFSDIRDSLDISKFEEASIIMPSLQMCSTDELDVVDLNIDISNSDDSELEWMVRSLSDGLMMELNDDYEESEDVDFIDTNEESEDVDFIDTNKDFEESQNPTEDEISEMEMDIIRKSLLGDSETM